MENNRYSLKTWGTKMHRIFATLYAHCSKQRRLCYFFLFLLASLTLMVTSGNGLLSFLSTSYSSISIVESAPAGSRTPETATVKGETALQEERKLENPEQTFTLSAADIPLLKSLEERKALLDKREQQLEIREKELDILQQRLEDKISTLALLRKEVEELMREKEAFEEKRLEHLVKVYEGMKPEEAAPLVERLSEDTAVTLFYQMKEKKVSQILGFIKPEIAAKISERLAVQQQKKRVSNKENL